MQSSYSSVSDTFYIFYRANDKTNIFTNEEDFPAIRKRKNQIEAVRREIIDHRREVRIALRQPSLDYVTVMGIEVVFNFHHSAIKLVFVNCSK